MSKMFQYMEVKQNLKTICQNVLNKKIFSISYMNPNKKTKFNDRFMKIDPPIWITADFKCRNIPVDDP